MFTRSPPPDNTNNDSVCPRNNRVCQFLCSLTPARFTMHYTINDCVGTSNHCFGPFPLQKLLEHNFKNPMFPKGPPTPFTTQTTTVRLYVNTVWVNFSVKTTRNYCFGQFIWKNYPCVGIRNHFVREIHGISSRKTTLRAPCLSGVPPPFITQIDCVVRRNQSGTQFLCKYYKELLCGSLPLTALRLNEWMASELFVWKIKTAYIFLSRFAKTKIF